MANCISNLLAGPLQIFAPDQPREIVEQRRHALESRL